MPEEPEDRITRGYRRGREADAAARAALAPLAPGERPRALVYAVILAAVLGLANVALWLGGYRTQSGVSPSAALLFAAVMATVALGMWQRNYWAVLGFQALLAGAIAIAALSLLVASNLLAAVLCIAVVAICAPLFWSLVRTLARLRMPADGPREDGS